MKYVWIYTYVAIASAVILNYTWQETERYLSTATELLEDTAQCKKNAL
jgi:hypothetical protein